MATPTVTAEPPTTVYRISIATFTPKDTLLDECIDFALTPPPGVDAGTDFLERVSRAMTKDRGASRLSKACAEQFQTTPALATCAVHMSVPADDKRDAGTIEIGSLERYYDLDSLTKTNEYMKDCLDMKGDWTGVDKNSAA